MPALTGIEYTCSMSEIGLVDFQDANPYSKETIEEVERSIKENLKEIRDGDGKCVIVNSRDVRVHKILKSFRFEEVYEYKGNDGVVHVFMKKINQRR